MDAQSYRDVVLFGDFLKVKSCMSFFADMFCMHDGDINVNKCVQRCNI